MLRPPAIMAMARRRRSYIAIASIFVVFTVWLTTPFDSFVYLMPKYYLSWPFADRLSDEQVFSNQPPPHPVDMLQDAVVILKSGYGTRDRIQGWLDAHVKHLNIEKLFLVADYEANFSITAQGGKHTLQMYDSVRFTIDASVPPLPPDTKRVKNHNDLQNAIAAGDTERLDRFTKEFGYEIDVMKFVSSLEMAYNRWPNEKWYIMADDDSYLMLPSAKQLLQQFDPSKLHYLGNPEGHWTGRFGHGGSNFMVSQGAMNYLFRKHRQTVGAGNHEASTTARLGDWLLGVTFNKIGIYVQEGHKRFFSGEDPWAAKMRADRVCSLLVGFHAIKTGDAMRKVAASFGSLARPATWWDVWDIMGEKGAFGAGAESHSRNDWDYIGNLDEATSTLGDSPAAISCQDECLGRRWCLAWTYEPEKNDCHLSPWMAVGKSATGKVSGISVARVSAVREKCPKH
ncbi:hypothetical protein RB594_005519 [Gaeumannomyces avenae]